MSSWRLSLLWFVLLLWDARPTDTAISVYKRPKGGELSINPWSDGNPNVTRRIFCKNDCEERDILVETTGSPKTNGRFSIKHEMKDSPRKDFIYVTISNLTLSDSGRYRCFWDRPVGQASSNWEFRIEVIDGVDAEPKYEISLAAGEDFRHIFRFSNPGKNKTFCRNSCSEEDILFQTMEDEGQSSRYSYQYKKHADNKSEVTVMIRNVSSADSGLYKYYLDQSSRHVWISVSSAPPGGSPVTVRPSEAPPEQEPTGRPGGASNTQNLTMILVLIPVCIVVIITVITLTICWKRRKPTDRGTGAGGTQNPEREYGNICPESVYQDLCLEDVEPSTRELNKIEITIKMVQMTGHTL